MNRLAVIWAVLVKDLRLHWPLAALTAGVILAKSLAAGFSMFSGYLPFASLLVSGLLALGLVQEDAPSSLRHDWLTRPIGPVELLLAKAAVFTLAVLLPAAAGPALAAARDGASVPEAFLSALSGVTTYLKLGCGLLAVGAITATLLEAGGVVFALFMLFIFVPPVLQVLSGLSQTALYIGYGWIASLALTLVAAVGGLVVLGLQYGARRTIAARSAFGAALGVAALVYVSLSWNVIFAVQQTAAPQDPAAGPFRLALAPGCFETETLDPLPSGVDPDASDGPWTSEQRRAAGFGAVSFSTPVRSEALRPGWRMRIGDVEGAYLDAKGAVLHRLKPNPFAVKSRTAPDGAVETAHAWLLSRARYHDLVKRAASLRLDYSLALLAPVEVVELAADGTVRRLPALGDCSAIARSDVSVQVRCFKAGLQPQFVSARLADAPPDQEVGGGRPDYAPDWLRFSAGRRREIVLRHPSSAIPPHVIVTAYEARGHLRRSVAAPGVLGGPPTVCTASPPTAPHP